MNILYRAAFIFLLCINQNAKSQQTLVGDWKVLIADNGVRYDCSACEYRIADWLLKYAAKDRDSIRLIESFIIQAKKLSGRRISFDKSGRYSEFEDGKQILQGEYQIEEKDNCILLLVESYPKNGLSPQKMHWQYQLIDGRLILSRKSLSMQNNAVVTLESVSPSESNKVCAQH